jgi:hypothetical protein
MEPDQRTSTGRVASPEVLQAQAIVALPVRAVLTVISPSPGSSFPAFADATQMDPTSQGAPANGPTLGQGLSAATDAAKHASAQDPGALAQNVNAPNSIAHASTTQP